MPKPTPEFVNRNYPIVAVKFFRNGAEIIRGGEPSTKRSRGRRDYITELSPKSLCKLAFTAQNLNTELRSMLCLTCGIIYPKDGVIFKGALNRTLSAMRYRYSPLEYLWFLEFQKRNAPHIHILTSVENPAADDREWLAEKWSKSLLAASLKLRSYEPEELQREEGKLIRQHRRTKVWERIRLKDGATRYVTKYAVKPEQKTVPPDFARVGRFWGVSKGAKPKHLLTNGSSEEEMRIHLANKNHPVAEYKVLPKLIWFREGD